MTVGELYKKNKGFINYIFFGVCTTLVNIFCYHLFFFVITVPNVPSTVLAWFFAILFAFFTNKRWVFNCTSWNSMIVVNEFIKFLFCRILTGIIDIVVMWFSVDKMCWNAMAWKCISNIIIIIINYIASKFLIFVDNKKTRGKNDY